ncbi:hypothetical protein NPIL_564551 [Nephila pilipes]|uniref:Uncharacterized protein n=1 Tax=Nephila pilipes TaxID=299642 RepID=A0A8X6PPS7_NEPPI|nr:hypothetical protein NPIL_564551 [Nephila pilipes]
MKDISFISRRLRRGPPFSENIARVLRYNSSLAPEEGAFQASSEAWRVTADVDFPIEASARQHPFDVTGASLASITDRCILEWLTDWFE